MVTVHLKSEANQQNLSEYWVGKTYESPGATSDNIDETFEHLRDICGDNVTSWHGVGPFSDHFRGRSVH